MSAPDRAPHLMTVPWAFETFAFRLQLKADETRDAELRQRAVMMILPNWFAVERCFYDGSFARGTCAKPIHGADLFVELGYANRGYRLRPPSAIIRAFGNLLAPGISRLHEETGRLVIRCGSARETLHSINLVPIFADGEGWAIPDRHGDRWLVTDPHHHTALALRAHNEFATRWRPVVQMMKCWNQEHDAPIKPGYLLEVIALDYLTPATRASWDLQVYGFFEALSKRLMEPWLDPSGIGPAITSGMSDEELTRAQAAAEQARWKAQAAITIAGDGNIDKALSVWQKLFGELFPIV